MRGQWVMAMAVGFPLLWAQSGHAQAGSGSSDVPPGPTVEGTTTTLHLEATASVQASPDELVADLMAQSTSQSAATAQRQVNILVAAGLAAAHSVAGIDARAIGYSVDPSDDKRTTWMAQQTLELRGHDGPSLLDLTGRLQQRGFVTASLDWQLSGAARRKAHDQATIDALKQLQVRAHETAAVLGLHVDHFSDVRLVDQTPVFQPRPGGPRLMAARMAVAPQATDSPEDVSADVSADVVLCP